jgi:hypothetical protein
MIVVFPLAYHERGLGSKRALSRGEVFAGSNIPELIPQPLLLRREGEQIRYIFSIRNISLFDAHCRIYRWKRIVLLCAYR